MVLETRLATAELWEDVQHALTGGGDGARCWCQYWLLPNQTYRDESNLQLRGRLHAELVAGPPRTLLAYLDGEAVGWVRVSPRPEQQRLTRTRVVKASPQPQDAPDVWAITCLVVRRAQRGKGIAHTLVQAAVDYARSSGARIVEAYPEDTEGAHKPPNNLYLGTFSLFTKEGFTEVARPTPRRPVMQLAVG